MNLINFVNSWIYAYAVDVQVDSLSDILKTMQLPKSRKIQLGNWEASVLSKDQLEYAATDAFASWYLYEVINCFLHFHFIYNVKIPLFIVDIVLLVK